MRRGGCGQVKPMEMIARFLSFCVTGFGKRAVAACLIVVFTVTVVAPPPAKAQFGAAAVIAAANAVVRLINITIGGLLDTGNGLMRTISGFVSDLSTLWQQVVWPINLINQARALVTQMVGQFRGLLSAMQNINVFSATLPNPSALESVIRNRGTADFAQLEQAYRNVFRPLPASTNIHPVDRDLIDMDDAMAMNTLKTLKAADQIVERTIQAAQTIEDEGAQMAPGSAPYLAAAGLIAAIQTQAMMQKMLAAELRQQAAMLAHQNASRKRSAAFADEFRRDASALFK